MNPTAAAFDMTIPEKFAQALQPLHPDGAQHAAAAALRLYLELGKLGVDALHARATHEDMSQAELILHLLAVVETPNLSTGTTMTPSGEAPRSKHPQKSRADNQDRDHRIAQEYFEGGITYSRLAAKYGLSTVRVTQIVSRAREMQRI